MDGGDELWIIKKYLSWCTDSFVDEQTKQELKFLKDEKEIEDKFYKELTFETGGLRVIIGGGMNRMNIYCNESNTRFSKCNYGKL